MSLKAMLKSGHTPTLFSTFFYFDVSFMVWVLLGPLGVLIGQDLHLNAAEKGLMVATPSLASTAAGCAPARCNPSASISESGL